jgi:3'(2'), 5'-bisphosphate nucleotidase
VTSQTSNDEELLAMFFQIARHAAHVIAEVYATKFGVEYKDEAGNDPITIADRRSNELICGRLASDFPGVPIVAEESDPATFAGFRSHDRVFFVDPLDGTREFIARNGEFVVMIGLLEKGVPQIGVIHAPATGIAWGGARGVGAYRIDRDGTRHEIRVSDQTDLSASRIVATRSHRSEKLERALASLDVKESRALGSAGLKCAEVAAGHAEAYVAPGRAGSRWDICAGHALIEVAGGRVTDSFGDPIDYLAPSLVNDRGIVASNGHVHETILERIHARTTMIEEP